MLKVERKPALNEYVRVASLDYGTIFRFAFELTQPGQPHLYMLVRNPESRCDRLCWTVNLTDFSMVDFAPEASVVVVKSATMVVDE